MISRSATEYKLSWIGNEKGLGGAGFFLTTKWVDQVRRRISNRVINIKVLVQGIIISMISVYFPQGLIWCLPGFDDCQKDDFYNTVINIVWKLEGKK